MTPIWLDRMTTICHSSGANGSWRPLSRQSTNMYKVQYSQTQLDRRTAAGQHTWSGWHALLTKLFIKTHAYGSLSTFLSRKSVPKQQSVRNIRLVIKSTMLLPLCVMKTQPLCIELHPHLNPSLPWSKSMSCQSLPPRHCWYKSYFLADPVATT